MRQEVGVSAMPRGRSVSAEQEGGKAEWRAEFRKETGDSIL